VLKDDDHPDSPKMIRKGWIIGIVLTVIDFAWIPFVFIPFAFMGVGQQMQQIPEPVQRLVPPQSQSENNCDTSYPDVCIPPYPPDLDCGEIQYANFKVLSPDPHGFDGDNDGIGCESGSTQPPTSVPSTPTKEISCDTSYPDVCIPPYPPDLDCGEIQFANFKVLPPDPHRFDGDKDGIGCESGSTQSSTSVQSKTKSKQITQSCSGSARCISGQVTQIIDGDTIRVDGQSIRFALLDTPEIGESGFNQARDFIEGICPVGSPVLVDEDDGQTQGSYDRIVAVIYCNGMNLNEQLLENDHAMMLTGLCDVSEFSNVVWAQKYGCGTKEIQPKENNCDPSYPDVCIPPSPPDLDCGEIQYANFKVLPPDPHRFDGDKDGIGCES